METTPKQLSSEQAPLETRKERALTGQAEATLQLNRSLLPIDEYAAREGVSKSIVEECGKLGIVQIRRCKGRMFVVDVPLSPYRYPSEAGEGATKPVDKGFRFAERAQNGVPDIRETAEERIKSNGEFIKAGAISALVEKMFRKASEITDKPIKMLDDEKGQVKKVPDPVQVVHSAAFEAIAKFARSGNFSVKARKISQLVSQMFRRACEIITKPIKTNSDKIRRSEEKAESTQIIQDNGVYPASPRGGVQSDPLTGSPFYERSQDMGPAAQVENERIWQVVALFSIVFLFATLLANIWFYMDRQTQLDKLNLAYANIQMVYSNFIKADQQVKALQNELDNSRAEISRMQNELDNSRAEVKTVQNKLVEARQNLRSIQHRNAQAVDRLDKQIRSLMAWLSESTESPQPASGSGISSQ